MSDDGRKSDAKAAQRGFGYSRPRGRPVLPESVRRIAICVSITPGEKAEAIELGEGNLSLGVRKALRLAKEYASVSAEALRVEMIRRAAESRDQLTVAGELPSRYAEAPGQATGSAFDD